MATMKESKFFRSEPASEDELNLLRRARATSDPKKIAAFMPAWLKRSLFKSPKPFVFVPDKAPVYPAWTKNKNIGPVPSNIPYGNWEDNLAGYIEAFEFANGLKPAGLVEPANEWRKAA